MRADYWKRYGLNQANSENLLNAIAGLERERNLYLVKLRHFERQRIRQKMRGIRQPRARDILTLLANSEDWLVYAGDYLIRKKHRVSAGKLSTHENAILCFWAIDYAVRNAGSIDEATNNAQFNTKYYDLFEKCCDEIRLTSGF